MLLRIQHETKLRYSDSVAETVFEVRMAPPVGRGPDEPGLPAPDHPAGAGHLVPRRVRQPGRPVQHHDALPGAGDPDDELRADPSPAGRVAGWPRPTLGRRRRHGRDRGAGVPPAQPAGQSLPTISTSSWPACPGRIGTTSGRIGHRALMEAVCGRLKYEKKVTTARTPVSEALALGRGVCQDFAHLFLGACRGLGPARAVRQRLHQPPRRAGHPRLVPGLGRRRDRLGRRRPDPRRRSSTTTTSSPPSAATTSTSPPTAASGRAGPRSRSPSPSRSSRSSACPPTGPSGTHRPPGPAPPGPTPSATTAATTRSPRVSTDSSRASSSSRRSQRSLGVPTGRNPAPSPVGRDALMKAPERAFRPPRRWLGNATGTGPCTT